MPSLLPRDAYCGYGRYLDQYDDCRYYRSNWDSYGRWIVVAGVILAGIFIFFIFACITARRRRAAGAVPFRGTGWAGGRTPAAHAPPQYTAGAPPQPYYGENQWNQQSPPPNGGPPVYVPPPNQYYGDNQGYFGGQQSGIELQQPQGAYQPPRGGDAVYNPPSGPPPGKDGIIR